MLPKMICLTTGCGNITDQPPRCSEHSHHKQPAHFGRVGRSYYGHSWAKLSKQLREEQPWCTRCGSTEDLTVDHVIPGTTEGGLMVLCRSCNSRKSGQDRRFRRMVDGL